MEIERKVWFDSKLRCEDVSKLKLKLEKNLNWKLNYQKKREQECEKEYESEKWAWVTWTKLMNLQTEPEF